MFLICSFFNKVCTNQDFFGTEMSSSLFEWKLKTYSPGLYQTTWRLPCTLILGIPSACARSKEKRGVATSVLGILQHWVLSPDLAGPPGPLYPPQPRRLPCLVSSSHISLPSCLSDQPVLLPSAWSEENKNQSNRRNWEKDSGRDRFFWLTPQVARLERAPKRP